MDEYISRGDVLDIVSQYCLDDDGSCSKADVDPREMLDEIEALPSADVQPVKHGRWITKSDVFYIAWQESGRRWEDMPYFATGLNFACSNCFEKFDVNAEGVEKWNGCPLCLARMDGDAK